jgi:hypothetical protein
MPNRIEQLNAGEAIIINVRKAANDSLRHLVDDERFVYCGDSVQYTSWKRSIWFNPFHKLVKQGKREEAIEKYRNYLLSNPDLIKKLPELRGKILGCWCYPEKCHCEVLKELL